SRSSFRQVCTSRRLPSDLARAAITPCAVISHASLGLAMRLRAMLPRCLDERDFVDLFQRGGSRSNLCQRRLAQEAHALFARRFPHLRSWFFLQNQFADAIGEIQQFVNRRTSPVAGPGTLNATLAFVEGEIAPLGSIHAACLELLGSVVDRLLTGITDYAYQTLRQDAIQCRDEVVRLHAHVEEAPNYIDHVVGVDGGEHQVTRKRRLNRYLRRLGVANFANQNLVRIVAQNRSQAAREGQSLLLVYGNLRDAANLVLDRIFNRDDLVLFALNLVQRGVECSRFPRTRRTSDQHHPVRLFYVPAKVPQVLFIEPDNIQSQLAKFLAHRFFVEHAKHAVFAMHSGHDRNTEID